MRAYFTSLNKRIFKIISDDLIKVLKSKNFTLNIQNIDKLFKIKIFYFHFFHCSKFDS